MIKAIDVIDRLPFEIAAALQCDPFFADIPVAVAERGNVVQEISHLQAIITAKGGHWGVAVVVLQMVADDNMPELAFGPLTLRPAIQVIEQPTQNHSNTGTGKSARKVCRKIRDVIKSLRLIGLTSDFEFEKNCIEPVAIEPANLVGYQLNCRVDEADDEPISQVLLPQFTAGSDPNNPTLVITCDTVGAAIYYTLDDSFPAPPARLPGSTAVLYAGEIPIPAAGFIIRAAAFLDPAIQSPVNRANVTITEINP